MLLQVRRSLERLGAEIPALDAGRLLCLDDSKGRVEGCILLAFPDGATEPSAIVKAAPVAEARRRRGRGVYEIDHENLETMERSGLSSERRRTPRPLGYWVEEGIAITAQSALHGPLMKNVPGRELFSAATAPATIGQIADWWHAFRKALGTTPVRLDDATYRSRILSRVERFRERFVTGPEEARLLEAIFYDEPRLHGIELPFVPRHGDFCAANVVMQPDGIAVFDWEFPLEPDFPLFDVFHFFASTRYPFTGRRGESSHFRSFREVYWGKNHMRGLLGETLAGACAELQIPPEVLPDLFLLSLIEIANLKYEGLLEVTGAQGPSVPGGAGSDAVKRSAWLALGGTEKDVPFACIRECVSENVRWVASHGFPELLAPKASRRK